jgi:alpha-amylase/alpha-mannosidase (GH57 family)
MNTTVKAKTALILHGHFYQPPRENPLVDLIAKQASAKPYHNWNEKIHDDCYRANAFSRYLDTYARVKDIVNNYKYISFNFGPTLLNWLEKYHKGTYEKILEADKSSIERVGYGNAIAQSYNHTILPLSNARDVETQIRWGIEDFSSRFNREPEGMWLPETAISKDVVTQLAKAKISFVILSPWQCKAIETKEGEFKNVDANEIPYWEPFILEGTDNSTISAFFYYPDLASSISFGHMLRDADAMYNTLLKMKSNNQAPLIHTATDGEIYGHHEPFGDMALAALVRKVEENDSFYFTNYSAYLAQNKPTKRAILHDGEEKKGTSWSCSHGVSRWYKDCGCHTGGEIGWNQKWRTPLRAAFENLAAKIDKIYDQKIEQIFKGKVDSIELLNGYSSVISKREEEESFEIEIDKDDNSWNVNLPLRGRTYSVSLHYKDEIGGTTGLLCRSESVNTPKCYWAENIDELKDEKTFNLLFSSVVTKGGTLVECPMLTEVVEILDSQIGG